MKYSSHLDGTFLRPWSFNSPECEIPSALQPSLEEEGRYDLQAKKEDSGAKACIWDIFYRIFTLHNVFEPNQETKVFGTWKTTNICTECHYCVIYEHTCWHVSCSKGFKNMTVLKGHGNTTGVFILASIPLQCHFTVFSKAFLMLFKCITDFHDTH